MSFDWQVPISSSTQISDRKRLLHWFEVSKRTDILVTSACGRQFNPGFATRRKHKKDSKIRHCKMRRCKECLEQLRRTK
jgi:hypothetical protein